MYNRSELEGANMHQCWTGCGSAGGCPGRKVMLPAGWRLVGEGELVRRSPVGPSGYKHPCLALGRWWEGLQWCHDCCDLAFLRLGDPRTRRRGMTSAA